MVKKIVSMLAVMLLALTFAACSDDDTVGPPAGYTEVKIYLDSSNDPLVQQDPAYPVNVPRLMGINTSGLEAVVGANGQAFDAWALGGANNIMTKIAGTEMYVLTVYLKLAEGEASGSLEYKFANGTPGYTATWGNKIGQDSYGLAANNWTAGGVTMGNTGGGDSSFTLTGWTNTVVAFTNYVNSWNAQGLTYPTLQACAVTLNITNVDAYTGVGTGAPYDFSVDYATCSVVGDANFLSASGTSQWTPADGTVASSYSAANGGTLVFSLNAPQGTVAAIGGKVIDSGSTWENDPGFSFNLPENAATATRYAEFNGFQ